MDRFPADRAPAISNEIAGCPRAAPRFSRHEEGSAYMVTLLVMLVLTVMGVSLTAVTQIERLSGAQDRQMQRIFYAADSGIGVATAKVLVANDLKGKTFAVAETKRVIGQNLHTVTDEVEIAPMIAIQSTPCNLCQINQGAKYFDINHALRVLATRNGTPASGDPDVALGRKVLTVMVDIQPMEQSTELLSNLVDDPEGLTQLTF